MCQFRQLYSCLWNRTWTHNPLRNTRASNWPLTGISKNDFKHHLVLIEAALFLKLQNAAILDENNFSKLKPSELQQRVTKYTTSIVLMRFSLSSRVILHICGLGHNSDPYVSSAFYMMKLDHPIFIFPSVNCHIIPNHGSFHYSTY